MKPCKWGHTGGRYKSGACKECQRAYYKKWHKANPEKKRLYERRWKEANPEKCAAYSRQAEAKKGGYAAALPATRPMPLVCEMPGCTRPVYALDHCHETGKFRGWLCNSCNMGIGKLGDNIEGVENALAYLKRAYSRPSTIGVVNV